jgi:hypothetical protein
MVDGLYTQFVQKNYQGPGRLTRPLSTNYISPALNAAYIFMARDIRAKMSDMYFYIESYYNKRVRFVFRCKIT